MIKFIPYETDSLYGIKVLENDAELGFCTFTVEGFNMNFTDIDCSDDILVEGLARAAMNYAANRNAYIAKIKKEHICPAFKRLGFSESDGLFVEIPEALTTGCSCSHE